MLPFCNISMPLISCYAHEDTMQIELRSDNSSAGHQNVLPCMPAVEYKTSCIAMMQQSQNLVSEICRVLSYLDRWGHQAVALESFSWMETHSNSEQSFDTADPFLYTRLMSMCRQTPAGYKSALQMFHNMQSKGIEPDVVAYNTAINAAGGCPVVMRS